MFVRKEDYHKDLKNKYDEGYLVGYQRGKDAALSDAAASYAKSWGESGRVFLEDEIRSLRGRNEQLEKELLIAKDRIDQLKFTGGK